MLAFIQLRQNATGDTALAGISNYSPAAKLFGTHTYDGKPNYVNTGKFLSAQLKDNKLIFKGQCAVIDVDESNIVQNVNTGIDGITGFKKVCEGQEAIQMKREWQEASTPSSDPF